MGKILNTFFNNKYLPDYLFGIMLSLFISPLWFWMYLRKFDCKFSK